MLEGGYQSSGISLLDLGGGGDPTLAHAAGGVGVSLLNRLGGKTVLTTVTGRGQ